MSVPQRILLLANDGERDRLRASLRSLEGFSLFAEAPASDEGFRLAQACPVELIVLGPSASGDLQARLAAARSEARIITLSAEEDALSLQRRLGDFIDMPPEPKANGKLIACYGAKGGAGRSILATNLGIALRQATGRETLLLDVACQHGELDLFLNLQPRQGLPAVLGGGRIDAALTPHPTGIHLLGWTKGERTVSVEKLKNLLLWLKQRDAWVVIDTHPSLREINRAVLELSDRVLVPFFLDIAHLRALQRDFQRLREEGWTPERCELVAWSERSDLSRQDAARILHQAIAHQLPYEPEACRAAINQGIPILQSDPHGSFAREFHKLIAPMVAPETTALVTFKANPFSSLLSWLHIGSASEVGT